MDISPTLLSQVKFVSSIELHYQMYVILVTHKSPTTSLHLSDGFREKPMLLNKPIRGWSWEIAYALQIQVNSKDLACHLAFAQLPGFRHSNTEDIPPRIIICHNTAIIKKKTTVCMGRLIVCLQEDLYLA